MSSEFQKAMASLHETHTEFAHNRLSPVAHGRAREAALIAAVTAMAAEMGVTLNPIYCIDANGELSLVTSGRYGEAYAGWLNKVSVRTGIYPGATMLPEGSWCRINHFEAERLVKLYEQAQS